MEDPRPFPKNKKLKSALNRNTNLTGLEQHLRPIYRGGVDGAEFVVYDGNQNSTRTVMESCLRNRQENVIIYDTEGRREELRLRRDDNRGGYVFSGPPIARIINGHNGEVELWGYPGEVRGNGFFVLTAV